MLNPIEFLKSRKVAKKKWDVDFDDYEAADYSEGTPQESAEETLSRILRGITDATGLNDRASYRKYDICDDLMFGDGYFECTVYSQTGTGAWVRFKVEAVDW